MKIPLHKFPDCVDYHELISYVESKHNIDVNDYAGRFSKENLKRQDDLKEKWLDENGYAGKAYVLNVQSTGQDWPSDSDEMKLRIEINTKYRDVEKDLDEEVPYLNFWHSVCDNINRGGVNYLCLDEGDLDEELPEKYQNWINEILGFIREVVEDNPAYDKEENVLMYHVDW